MMKSKSSPKSHRFLRAAGYTIAAMIWVAAATIASQLVLGYAMLFMLGANTLNQPVWTAVYSALSYVLAMILIIIVPLPHSSVKKCDKTLTTRNLLSLVCRATNWDFGAYQLGPTSVQHRLGFLFMLSYRLLSLRSFRCFHGLMRQKHRMQGLVFILMVLIVLSPFSLLQQWPQSPKKSFSAAGFMASSGQDLIVKYLIYSQQSSLLFWYLCYLESYICNGM